MQTPAPVLMTAEDLLADPFPYLRTELVRGHLLVREPPGFHHGDVIVRAVVAISAHLTAEQHRQGWAKPRGRLVAGDTGFTLRRNPDTVRAPDVAYIRIERWPKEKLAGYAEFAPDLAVEVRSPSDRAGSTLARVTDLLTAGTLLVWIIDPARRTARVYRADGGDSTLAANESLSGEDVIPGLVLPLSELFD